MMRMTHAHDRGAQCDAMTARRDARRARAMRDARARPLPSGVSCCELPTTQATPMS